METFLIRPNRAQWDRRSAFCLGTLLAIAIGLWVVYAWIGAWPILVFGALELVGITAVVLWVARHHHDYEQICIDTRMIVLTVSDGDVAWRREFPTYWTRIDYRSSGSWYPKRLRLRFRETQAEIATSMIEEDRDLFAAKLTHALIAARSPQLDRTDHCSE